MKKVCCFLISFLLVFSTLAFQTTASNNLFASSPVTVNVSTNKDSYGFMQVSKVTVKITNNLDEAIEDVVSTVSLENAKIVGRRSKTVFKVNGLNSGETATYTFKAIVDSSKAPVSLFVRFILKLTEFFYGTNKDSYNFDLKDTRVGVNSEEFVRFGTTEVGFKVKTMFKSDCLEITSEQSDFTTKNINGSLNGIVSSVEAVDVVNVLVIGESDTVETATSYGALVSFDEWEADLKFKPGINTISMSAKTVSGLYRSTFLEVNYNMGQLTSADNNSIVEEEGVTYFKGVLNIFFERNVNEMEANRIITSNGGTVIGQNYYLNMYQAKFNAENYDALSEVTQRISNLSEVESVCIDEILDDELYPSDPWDSDVSRRDWTDDDVDGSNWGLEAIDMVDAWEYNERMAQTPTRVGIVDSGYELTHKDIGVNGDNMRVHHVSGNNFSGSVADHGTHVLGTIAAAANNSKGLSGIVWNGDCYVASAGTQSGGLQTSALIDGIVRVVTSGAKVFNCSFGLSVPVSKNNNAALKNAAKSAIITMAYLMEDGFDFLAVQSAGNSGDEGVEAIQNGWFCSLNSSMDISDITRRFTVQDLIDRTIIVAAAKLDDYSDEKGYALSDFSCYGSRVDVAAPGQNIYSTVSGNGYDYYNGTSMAAPHVTAAASLLWSINHDFTAPEIKTLICSEETTTKAYRGNTSYRMLNVSMAIDEAVRLTDAEGTVYGRFVDAENGEPISGTFTIFKNEVSGSRYDNRIYEVSSDGIFSLTIPAGRYVLLFESEGYMSKQATVIVEPFEELNYGDYPVSKKLSENQMRIVLSWGQNPSDLDSHIVGYTESGSAFHVAYYDRTSSDENVWLDVDDTSSYGPETITIENLNDIEEFTYYIHNYTYRSHGASDSGAYSLSDSDAHIDVYAGDRQIASWDVPTNRQGTVWSVFKYSSNNSIIRTNTFSFENKPESVGEGDYAFVSSMSDDSVVNLTKS